eukprot:m51a1_g11479 hypothetical protein (138) ;mRNA; r:8814-10859
MPRSSSLAVALALVASTIPSAVSAALQRAYDDPASLQEAQFLCDLSGSTDASKLWTDSPCGKLPCPPMPCGEPLCPSVFSGIKCDISGHIALLRIGQNMISGTIPPDVEYSWWFAYDADKEGKKATLPSTNKKHLAA